MKYHMLGRGYQNKARNSHKHRLGKYVQQGNVDRIENVFREIPFHVLFEKGGDIEHLPFMGLQNLYSKIFCNIM